MDQDYKRTKSALDSVPLAIRSYDTLGAGFERRIRRQLASKLSHGTYRIARVSVRFEDINGPRGGVDTVCRIKLVMKGRPSIVVEKRAASHAPAFATAVTALGTAIDRLARKPRPARAARGVRAGRAPAARTASRSRPKAGARTSRKTTR